MKITIIFILLLFTSVAIGQTYYVSATSLNLRSDSSSDSKIIETLSQYSNVELIEDGNEWVKVKLWCVIKVFHNVINLNFL